MPDRLDLQWRLSQLPSPQHRAGLGGLLFLLDHTSTPHTLDSGGLALALDLPTLESLLAVLYRGADTTRLRKQEQRTVRRPAGAWLNSLGAAHHALWQDQMWFVLRPIAAARRIYDQPIADLAQTLWKALGKQRQGQPASLPLSSALYAGARAKSAEGVDFKEKPDHVLLLHFAHALAQPFALVEENAQGQEETAGSILVFLDPGDLTRFLSGVKALLASRDSHTFDRKQFRATHASCAEEAALAVLCACPHLSAAFAASFVQHGHTVNVASSSTISAEIEGYQKHVESLQRYAWRRLASQNLVAGRPLHRGVAHLLSHLDANGITPASEATPLYLQDARSLLRPGPHSDLVKRWIGRHSSHRDPWPSWARAAARLSSRLRGARSKGALGNLLAELALGDFQAELQQDWTDLADQLLLATAAHCRPA